MDSKIFRSWGYTTNFFQSGFLVIIRLYWGFLFFVAGLLKLLNMSSVIPFFQQFGLPVFIVYLVALGELVCGILLFIGILSRLASVITTIIMLGAYIIVHPENFSSFFTNPPSFFMVGPFAFLMASLIILFFGPGLFSVDALIMHRKIKKAQLEEKLKNEQQARLPKEAPPKQEPPKDQPK